MNEDNPEINIVDIAEELFGPMRSSTKHENELISDLLMGDSDPIGLNVFEMDEIDYEDC